MTGLVFSFDALDRRLNELPDGPSAVMNTPRWILPFNLAGWIGVLLGLLPSALIHFLTPALWMVWMTRAGLGLAIVGFAPGFIRSLVVLGISFWHWRPDQARQLDHDFGQYRELRDWLCRFSVPSCLEALRFARRGRERLASKLGLIAGSLEKVGILPMAVAVILQLKAFGGELGDVPLWQAVLAMFLVVIYAIGFLGALMRVRLELYEMILVDSLESRGAATELSGQ